MMKISRMVSGTTISSRASARFSLSYSPDHSKSIALRQLDFLLDLLHGVLNRAPQIAASHVERHGGVAAVAFAVDVIGAVFDLHFGELRQRDAFSRRGEQANVGDGLLGIAIRRLVAHHHVVALLALQHLADGVAAHGGLDGVLYVGHVDSKTGRLPAVDGEVEIRLAERVKELEVLEAGHVRHGGGDFVALLFESLQVIAEKLERKLAFGPGDRLAHVVFDGLREIPEGARGACRPRDSWRRSVPLCPDERPASTDPSASGPRNTRCCRILRCRFHRRAGPLPTRLW